MSEQTRSDEPDECGREDCRRIAATASEVYCTITGGLLSYPTYDARTILAHYEDDVTKQVDEETVALRAQVADLQAQLERANRQLGECIGCVDEPDECCPQHGRRCAEWIEIASEVIGRNNAARNEVEPFNHPFEQMVVSPYCCVVCYRLKSVHELASSVAAALAPVPPQPETED